MQGFQHNVVLRLLFVSSLCMLGEFGCADQSQIGDLEGQPGTAGMTGEQGAGMMTSGVTPPLSGIQPPPSGVEAGIQGGISGGMEMSCQSCTEACPAIECDCPTFGPSSFEGCQDDCCQTANEALCTQLCATLQPPPPECEIDESRCLEGTPSAIQRCNSERQWEIYPCEAETECQLDLCLPVNCTEGVRECLDASRLAECQGGTWVLVETCDQVCAGGECTSASCANAIRERSYLGCEYMALELPNTVARGSINPPPVAVVLTNPSATESAHVSLYDPMGQITDLQDQVIIPIAEDLVTLNHPDYSMPQTIRSEIRDQTGMIIEQGVLRADQIQIPPQGIGTFLLPHTSWLEEGSLIAGKAYRVVSDAPVGAYQFAPYCCNYSFSNDASLLVPTSALTGNYRYLGAPAWFVGFDFDETFQTVAVEIPATMAVIATRDQTTVRFTLPSEAHIQAETSGRLIQNGTQYVANLNKQETLLIRTKPNPLSNVLNPLPQSDLTNTIIEADGPVAVFSGHECTNYPHALGYCDHLEEQLFPVEAWGRQFNLIPAPERGNNAPFELVYWKILASEPDTRVTLSASFQDLNAGGSGVTAGQECGQMLDPNDPSIIILTGEGYCEMSTKAAFTMLSDKPISVMGILSGQESIQTNAGLGGHLGDPAAFLAAPVRQYRADYAFLTPNSYYSDFVTISFNEGTQITLDGEILDTSAAQTVQGGQTQYLHVPLEDGAHQIRGTTAIGITIFAFDDFVSYAFTGGLNLTKR